LFAVCGWVGFAGTAKCKIGEDNRSEQ